MGVVVAEVLIRFFPFFLSALRAVLRNVEMESVSLKKPNETPSEDGISKVTGLSATNEVVVKEDNSPAVLSVKS